MIFCPMPGFKRIGRNRWGKVVAPQSQDSPRSEIFTRRILRFKSFRFQQKLIRNKVIC